MARGKEMETREEYIQLSDSCDFLEHYHQEHTTDMVTRFRGKGGRPDIYVVGDPEWKSKVRDLMVGIFPERVPDGKKRTRRLTKRMRRNAAFRNSSANGSTDPTPEREPKQKS